MKDYKHILKNLENEESKVYFIHYSCQSLSDDNEGYSPKITSIAILHMLSSQMHSFSVHLTAEEMGVSRDKIFEQYDEIESIMLKRFFDFINTKRDAIWLHWNMSNINYGFEVLEHRYKVLTGNEAWHIDENLKFNISSLIKKKFGSDYVAHSQMINLMLLNGGQDRNFLNGEEEVRAFKAKEFVKLHNSTMCKTYFFKQAFTLFKNSKLRTDKNQFSYKLNQLYQNPIVQIVSIIGIIATLVTLIISAFKKT